MRATLLRLRPSALLSAIASHPRAAPALTSGNVTLTYGDLVRAVQPLTRTLQEQTASAIDAELDPPRVAFLTPPTRPYAVTLLASWAAGRIAVPLSSLYPASALASIVDDSAPHAIVTSAPYNAACADIFASHTTGLLRHVRVRECDCAQSADDGTGSPSDFLIRIANSTASTQPAMLLYTSGTTGVPKGVVWSHGMLDYQVSTMSAQWRWSSSDRILNVLPLHHVHGIVNVLLTALYAGAHCAMMEKFDACAVWDAFIEKNGFAPTVFMAVPTIYQRLIREYEQAVPEKQAVMREAAARLRLFVCGSAALAEQDFDAWRQISGHCILERYGMTEIGMALSNLYDDRVPGSLGVPFPGLETKILADGSHEVRHPDDCSRDDGFVEGELVVRGPGVFSRYWERESETAAAFDSDGWFQTGDIVQMHAGSQRFRMQGRASTDIIKTGGYKVSALEVERALADCPSVQACAVIGVEDRELGQRIVCVVTSPPKLSILPEETRHIRCLVTEWLQMRLPRYKIPRDVHVVADLPRNALGKIQKNLIIQALKV
jgi:malonyl-CoA/methylmalonyl-CoA synthetase